MQMSQNQAVADDRSSSFGDCGGARGGGLLCVVGDMRLSILFSKVTRAIRFPMAVPQE